LLKHHYISWVPFHGKPVPLKLRGAVHRGGNPRENGDGNCVGGVKRGGRKRDSQGRGRRINWKNICNIA